MREYRILPYTYEYDFYLPDINVLIEYYGLQHYTPIEKWGGEVRYLHQIERDKEKDRLAKIKNMKLIRIPYFNYNNLEETFLFKLSKFYKYRIGNTFYRDFLHLCEENNLPSYAKLVDYSRYKVY